MKKHCVLFMGTECKYKYVKSFNDKHLIIVSNLKL